LHQVPKKSAKIPKLRDTSVGEMSTTSIAKIRPAYLLPNGPDMIRRVA